MAPAGVMAQQGTSQVQPETYIFEDDGTFPNSELPLLLYRRALDAIASDLAAAIERRFAANNWTGAWRNGVYPFHHYHSTSHEVLAVFAGNAMLRLGGPKNGVTVEVQVGDVIVIPAGVAHRNLGSSGDFGVVGAYPGGRRWDLLRGEPGERPIAERNIAEVPRPEQDPLYSEDGPLLRVWMQKPK